MNTTPISIKLLRGRISMARRTPRKTVQVRPKATESVDQVPGLDNVTNGTDGAVNVTGVEVETSDVSDMDTNTVEETTGAPVSDAMDEEVVEQESTEEDGVEESVESTEEDSVEETTEDDAITTILNNVVIVSSGGATLADVAMAKLHMATIITGISTADYDDFNPEWNKVVKSIRDNVDTTYSDTKFMSGMLPPEWMWDSSLGNRLITVMTMVRAIVKSKAAPREYFETVDINKLVKPPVNFSDKFVENLTKFYNL